MGLALALVAAAAVCLGPAGPRLGRARWPGRAPHAAIALWQALGVAGVLALVAAGWAMAVAPLHDTVLGGLSRLVGGLAAGHPLQGLGLGEALGLTLATDITAVLVGGLVVTGLRTLRRAVRHRYLLDLVSVRSERVPGASLVSHPAPAAYCLPGLRPRVVLSTGAVERLAPDQLSAVVAHEHAHVREHHELVIVPFQSLTNLFSWVPYVRAATAAVPVLVEMAADDRAARHHGRRSLATALVAMASEGVPSCALAASTTAVAERVARLTVTSPPPGRAVSLLAWTAAVATVAVPVVALARF
jgi:Zn-dependent protease with chaperone function